MDIVGKSSGTLTDDEGNFSIDRFNVAKGRSVRVRASRAAYVTFDKNVTVPTQGLSIKFMANSHSASLQKRLQAPAPSKPQVNTHQGDNSTAIGEKNNTVHGFR